MDKIGWLGNGNGSEGGICDVENKNNKKVDQEDCQCFDGKNTFYDERH